MGKAYSNDEKSLVFKGEINLHIQKAIEQLCRRVKCTVKEPNLSYREMLKLIAPHDHIDFLMQARDICDIGSYPGRDSAEILVGNFGWRKAAVTFKVSGSIHSPVMPRPANQPLWLNNYPENRHLALEIARCAEHHAQISVEWGTVKAVFKYLNRVCKTPQQIRYLWPSILGIMAVYEDNLWRIRQEIAPMRVPSNLPTLPLKVRALLRETSQTVAMALLLPPLEDDEKERKDVEMMFTVDSGGSQVAEDLWVYPIND